MKITLSIDSKESIEIERYVLARFIDFMDDDAPLSKFFSVLASHPASEVRCAVASKSCLPIDLLEKMAHDESVEVVQEVACNETALNCFDQHQLQAMIDRDVSVASQLADNLFLVNLDKRDDLIYLLNKHPDPQVVDTVAEFVKNI
ncbi:MAG: hypothetical protein Q8O64_16845 [Sideroxyarcus sp.]|nr:hypothetical protein [Sideroxyarcus sp.]